MGLLLTGGRERGSDWKWKGIGKGKESEGRREREREGGACENVKP